MILNISTQNQTFQLCLKCHDCLMNTLSLVCRYFRTSYESQFSTYPNNYSISCTPTSPFVCTWSQLMDVVSKFENVSVFASIWSPPLYMKNILLDTLKESHEKDFYYFIKNITKIIEERFNVSFLYLYIKDIIFLLRVGSSN